MNKKYILIPAVLGIMAAGLIAASPLHSQGNVPYPEIKEEKGRPPVCDQAFINQMTLMRTAWEGNLELLTQQEIPASEMVDDAFEGVRTYRCWLEYLCRAVLYSGDANPGETGGLPLGTAQLGTAPGCAAPEGLIIPGTELAYIPSCATAPAVDLPVANFNSCMNHVELQFGDPVRPDDESVKETIKNLGNEGTVYLLLEKKLRQVHAAQRARVVEQKLMDIVTKTQAMEGAAQRIKMMLFKLSDLLPCYLNECT